MSASLADSHIGRAAAHTSARGNPGSRNRHGDSEIVRQSEFRVLRQNRPAAPAEEGDDAKQTEVSRGARRRRPRPYFRNPNKRTFRKQMSIISGDRRGFNIYISPNYFAAWVERSKNPWVPLAFCVGSRAVWRFSAGKTDPIEELTSKVRKVTCFTVHFGPGFRGGADLRTLSRIRASRALWPANGATRRKSRRGNTVLPERRLRRSRARGAVRFRTRHPSRGSGTSARGLRVNLRDICDVRF